MKSKNVLFTGATGMIGNLVLKKALQHSDIKQITSISRRPSGLTHPKLNEVIHKDFKNFQPIQQVFENQDVAYFCLGVYTSDVTTEQLKEITVDYTISFADLLRKKNEKTSFNFLSGQGADLTEKSWIPFSRFKGMAENHLLSLNFENLHIYRPGYIYPVHPTKEQNLMLKVSRILYPYIKKIMSKKNFSVTSEELATCIFELGLNDNSELKILENKDILEYLEKSQIKSQ